MNQQPGTNYKLFMVLLGSKAPGRHIEQHDFFFGIGTSIKELVPEMKAFWPEAGSSLHIDGWREVNTVDGYSIVVSPKGEQKVADEKKLFFINLGGYKVGDLAEQHYTMLSVQTDQALAVQESKKTVFFKTNTIAPTHTTNGANAHVDDKYGVDVDDIYRIEDILLPHQKVNFSISIIPNSSLPDDEIYLGYFKLDKL